jgi:hypothetical protein
VTLALAKIMIFIWKRAEILEMIDRYQQKDGFFGSAILNFTENKSIDRHFVKKGQ